MATEGLTPTQKPSRPGFGKHAVQSNLYPLREVSTLLGRDSEGWYYFLGLHT